MKRFVLINTPNSYLGFTRHASLSHSLIRLSSDKTYPPQDWAFEAREFLRSLTVGKEITFTSTRSISSSAENARDVDVGTAEINGLDVSIEILKNGWAKLKESKREPTEEDLKKREAEAEAKNGGKGVWNPHGPQVRAKFLLGGAPSLVIHHCAICLRTLCQCSKLNAECQCFIGQDGGIQHAGRFASIYGRLERETD